jgi:protein TonB
MFSRLVVATPTATAVTFGLLLLMQLLIASGRGDIDEAKQVRLDDFIRVEREQTVETREPKPDKPPPPQARPDVPAPELDEPFDNALAVAMTIPDVETSVSVSGIGFGAADGEYLPIVKVAPDYPARAMSRGLEGYVLVEFSVTTSGAVKDIVVLESTASIFERPAIEAASKFKYRPRVVNGTPVEVHGVQNRIIFDVGIALSSR